MMQSQLFFNKCFDKNKLKGLISWSLRNYGEATTLDLVEKLKDVGFFWATQAGISLSIDDLKIPKEKRSLLVDAETLSAEASEQFSSGNVTIVERLQQLIDAWHRTSETLKQEVVSNFRRSDPLNPVYMMAFSGARGNISQVRQLVGMRGLMADPQGRIIDFPIRSNFREGLTLTEYVISCYGARKGIVDTALRTATSGYLTRRLVDVAQHIVVSNYDCQTDQGIPLFPLKQGAKVVLPLAERILGRVLAENIPRIAPRNTCISQYVAMKISNVRESVMVRSPLLCKTKNGVCQLCYGWSLAHHELVSIGEAVGVIAAQSIGEPGTQLTMRTFHTGGVFSGEIIDQVQAPKSGSVYFSHPLKGVLVRTSYGKIGFLTRESGILVLQPPNGEVAKAEEIKFPVQSVLFVRQGQTVEKDELLFEYASAITDQDQGIQATQLVIAPQKGEVFFEDVVVLSDEQNTEAEAYQLGSFWLLTSHLYTITETSYGEFSYDKGDLLQRNAPFSMTKVVNENLTFPYFHKFSGKIGQLRSKAVDLPVFQTSYQQGDYLSLVSPASHLRKTVSLEKQEFFSRFDRTCLSIPGFLRHSTRIEEYEAKKQAKLFFVFSNKNLWPYFQTAENSTKNYPAQKKFYSFYCEGESLAFALRRTSFKTKKTAGSYCFKQKPASIPGPRFEVPSKFYSEREAECLIKTEVLSWTSSWKNFSFFDLPVSAPLFVVSNILKRGYSCGLLATLQIKPAFPQLPLSLFLHAFTRQQNPPSRFFRGKGSRQSTSFCQNVNMNLKVVKQLFVFPTFSSFSPAGAIENKQLLDSTFSFSNSFDFDLTVVNRKIDHPVFLFECESREVVDELNWVVDKGNFQTLSIYGQRNLLLPQKPFGWNVKPTGPTLFEWKLSKQKFIHHQAILGQINKNTTEKIEVFKQLPHEKEPQFLYLKKADMVGLRNAGQTLCTDSVFVGSLVRPGNEVFADKTVADCGQILSISKTGLVIRKAVPILFSSKANFHVFHGDFIEKGLPLITLTYKRLTTGDIVQGIPRIEQLFEARQTTTLLHEQLHELFETYKTRMRLEVAARKSFQKIQRILIDSIQRVYQSQGVTISDKHLEVIVRQMTSTVRILEGGRTRLLRGELKSIDWIEKVNAGIDIQKAEYEPILLGITKASLETESFISAASFQETTRTLSRAAIEGRTDFLRGLKENVILGHRVPAGTGAPLISYLTKFTTDAENVEELAGDLNFLLKE
jgi:RNA polymerase Rpb1, domain 5/RNA polymerase Rpb1, domain 4